jgi:transcriptional regulator with XRE-family HTH domain
MPDIIRRTYAQGQAVHAPGALEEIAPLGYDDGMRAMSRIRKSRGLSQAQLAEMVGCTQATISRIEDGKGNTSVEMIEAIAAALRVAPSALFETSELQARITTALADLTPDQQRAALVVLEAMASSARAS